MAKSEHLNLKGGTAAKAILRRCPKGRIAETGVGSENRLL
jgi:hypothetical protein